MSIFGFTQGAFSNKHFEMGARMIELGTLNAQLLEGIIKLEM